MCPTCHAAGVASDCDAKIENKRCYEEDPVCLVTSSYYGQQISTKRDCAPRKFYPFHKSVCKITGRCATAMCDTSGCMAELSSGN